VRELFYRRFSLCGGIMRFDYRKGRRLFILMVMQVVLPDVETRASFEVCGDEVNGERPLSDEEFFDFCMKNPDLHIERHSNGEIVILPPAGMETSYRNSDVSSQLGDWAKMDGRGVTFDSSAEFILPTGAAFAPDASWILKSRLTSLTKAEKELFGRLCPDFVIELKSPSDRLRSLKSKMDEWIANGAQLAWLIVPEKRTVYIYRPGTPPEELSDIDFVAGEGPVAGFRLELADIWEGL
jgi:Uma2 family endonuclease